MKMMFFGAVRFADVLASDATERPRRLRRQREIDLT